MAGQSQVEKYDLFECGSFWDLAVVFGFSNAADGDSFEVASTPKCAVSKSFRSMLVTSSPFAPSWTTLALDEDELSMSRNRESGSPNLSLEECTSPEQCQDDTAPVPQDNFDAPLVGLSPFVTPLPATSIKSSSTPRCLLCTPTGPALLPSLSRKEDTKTRSINPHVLDSVALLIDFSSPVTERSLLKLS